MKSMGKLVDMYTINETMRDMAYEMEKAGLIQEMMDETIDGAMEEEGLDDEGK
jgi:charged multivesicular body protein 3